MAFDLDKITLLSELVTADPQFARQVWNATVHSDARDKNEFAPYIGGEMSGKPVCEKNDLKAGGKQKVTFTTTGPVRGRGVQGEQELKSNTGQMIFGTFPVTIDLIRFAITDNQLLQLLRLNDSVTPEQLEFTLTTEWWGRREMDDIQMKFLNTVRYDADAADNLIRIGGHTDQADLAATDTMYTGMLEMAKGKLIGIGGKPMKIDTDIAGSDVPQYLYFGPKDFTDPLKDEQKFRDSLLHAQVRGSANPFFNGKLPLWDNVLIHRHNVIIDTADGRQGSPLAPIAFLGAPLADATPTTITGGGKHNIAGTKTNVKINDYFAYFPGYYWSTWENESAPSDSNTYYAMIYNPDGTYEGISYEASGNDGCRLTSVTREVTSIIDTGHARYSNAHPTGAKIIPCTENGIPLGWALVLGAEAQFLAKGAVDVERIKWSDDFVNDSGRAHVNSIGVQGIRGYSCYQDSLQRFPNFMVVEGAMERSGIELAS